MLLGGTAGSTWVPRHGAALSRPARDIESKPAGGATPPRLPVHGFTDVVHWCRRYDFAPPKRRRITTRGTRAPDHARGDRGVGDLVDQHEAAGHAVVAVVVDDERVGGLQGREADLVGRRARRSRRSRGSRCRRRPRASSTRTGVTLVVCFRRRRWPHVQWAARRTSRSSRRTRWSPSAAARSRSGRRGRRRSRRRAPTSTRESDGRRRRCDSPTEVDRGDRGLDVRGQQASPGRRRAGRRRSAMPA